MIGFSRETGGIAVAKICSVLDPYQVVEVLRNRYRSSISNYVAEPAELSTTTSVGRLMGMDDHDQRHWLRLMETDDRIGVIILFPCQEILAGPVSLSYAHPSPSVEMPSSDVLRVHCAWQH
jgi:hypothetical protein